MNIILLSGGSGQRLWPLSNEIRSKQFIKIFHTEDGGLESMVQRVYRQIREADPEAKITIATSKAQISSIHNQLGENVGISMEPCRRDTFPAIALAVAYLQDVQGVTGTDQAEVHSELEQLQVNLLEGEELDVKAVLSFSTTVMKNIPLEAIEGVEEQEIDSNVLAGLPSAVIYIAAPGDDLWSIGRKYHMPVKTVRELNALESDELRPGQKVLLVKGLA
jgi:hypothetical protein